MKYNIYFQKPDKRIIKREYMLKDFASAYNVANLVIETDKNFKGSEIVRINRARLNYDKNEAI